MFGSPIGVVILVAGTVFLGWLAWISIQSLLQGKLLREARGGGVSGLEAGRRVALHGAVRLKGAVRKRGLGDLLWYRCKTQELRGWGRRRRWVTVGEEKEVAAFGIEVLGREIRVEGYPTEVQSEKTETEHSGPGFFGIFHANGDQRTTTEYLPVSPRLTVLGRLERRGADWAVVEDAKVGLLLSPEEPGQAATWEILKGALGLLAVTAAIVAGLFFYYGQGR